METPFRTIKHAVDVCVVGGGLAGLSAAIAAARRGSRVTIMQDRPMFGGNASSEVRMWVCGANGSHRRETGFIEELELENIARNPHKVYSLWDQIMWDFAVREPNLTAIMNCSCLDAEMNDPLADGREVAALEAREPDSPLYEGGSARRNAVRSVTGWQSTTQIFHSVKADVFIDASGDSVLAPLTGAEYRIGREAAEEFNESIEPETSDRLVMGMSVLIQAREMDQAVAFEPPPWAHYYESVNDLPERNIDPFKTNFWWIELGGTRDTIHETEAIRAELVARAYGVWDLIKNRSGQPGVEKLEIEHLGLFPGKRESRRYVGDYIVNQNDVRAEGKFHDVVSYGGWSMDDHHPGALDHPGKPTIHHSAPSPWGIPYRSLYSKNIDNLLFAGRNISVSHIALSSSRVMRTCAIIGQAAGTAAALTAASNVSPRDLGKNHLRELQQTLMNDDAWLPGFVREPAPLTRAATLTATATCIDRAAGNAAAATRADTRQPADPEPLRNGLDRYIALSSESWAQRAPSKAEAAAVAGGTVKVGDEEFARNSWRARPGDAVTFEWDRPVSVGGARLVFDSNLNRYYREHRMRYGYFRADEPVRPAPELVKGYRIEVRTANETAGRARAHRERSGPEAEARRDEAGWQEVITVTDNHQRLNRPAWDALETTAMRLTILETWGNEEVEVFAIDVV